MKVLMLGWEFPPFIKGGLGPATADLALALARRGHQLTFALPYKLPVSSKNFQILFAGDKPEYSDELIHHYSSVDILRNESIPAASKREKIRSLVDEVRLFAGRLKRLARDIDFDLVHAHDWLTMPAGQALQSARCKPLVSHVHATEYYRSGGQGANEQVYAIERDGLRASDSLACVSQHVKNVVMKEYSVPEQKISVINNGVSWQAWQYDVEQIKRLKSRHKIVLSVGRLTIQKGVDYLIQAAEIVHRYVPEAIFVIIGDGDMKQQLLDYTQAHRMMNYVLFTGWLKHSEITQYYAAADVFVMPSVAEPFGLVALEAALLDTPVIMSKTCGASDVFKHCLNADYWDSRLLASHIIDILKRKSLSRELAVNGKKNVDQITWEKAAEKVENIYKQLVH